jgi:hypothetical protein
LAAGGRRAELTPLPWLRAWQAVAGAIVLDKSMLSGTLNGTRLFAFVAV